MTRVALIDADTLVYEAARANEVAVEWEPEVWSYSGDLDAAKACLTDKVRDIQENLGADRIVMTLSDYTDPWRKRVMPTYKSNRKDTRRPVLFKPLREFVHEVYPDTYQRPGLEGDDVLGILLTNTKIIQGEKIVVSIDKDMQTLPGLIVNLKRARETGDWTPTEISEHAADYHHLYQTLTGDTVDGYPGCPGVGPVKAKKILQNCLIGTVEFDVTAAWSCILDHYAKAGLSEEVALQNARVARICRASDYNFTTKEVRLWNPQ